MTNVKLLWIGNGLLLLAVIVLSGLLVFGDDGVRPAAPEPSASPGAPPKDRTVASIGGMEITSGMLEQVLMQKYGAETVDHLLDQLAIQLEAGALGLTAEPAEIERELQRMMEGYINAEDFFRAMKDQLGMSEQELREDIYYKLLLEKIAIHDVEVTDAEIDRYIEEHPEEFRDHVELRLQQIVTNSLEQANRVIELAKEGVDFASLAVERSLERVSAEEGGDIGWFEDDDPFLPEPILNAAKVMKVGEISQPIPIDDEYYIIRLSDRKEISRGTPEEMRESVRKQLALQKTIPLTDLLQNLRFKYGATIHDETLRKNR